MKWCILVVLAVLLSTIEAQRTHLFEVPRKDETFPIGTANKNVNIQVPHFLTSGIQLATQVPYVEILKLIESFLRLKGQVAGQFWALLNDNAHVLAALRDTLVGKISTLHSFTLTAVVILRKVLEFASTLFSGFNVNVQGSGGHGFGAGVSFG